MKVTFEGKVRSTIISNWGQGPEVSVVEFAHPVVQGLGQQVVIMGKFEPGTRFDVVVTNEVSEPVAEPCEQPVDGVENSQ